MTITAIETRYAGCRFRSRLEARWAVFFDHLGIRWEYEAQGFQCSYRLTLTDGTFPYLPDFWLPDLGVLGEVKGDLDGPATTRLLDAAAALSSNNGGGCHDSGGTDLVVFGPIPEPWSDRLPVRLHMHKGDLIASRWLDARSYPCSGVRVATDDGGGPVDRAERMLLEGMWGGPDIAVDLERLAAARTAARSARFEHGQRG